MNVCFELKPAVQVLRQRAAASSPHRELSERSVRDLGERKGRAPVQGGKHGKVQCGKGGRQKLQDIYTITPSYLACTFLLCYGLAVLAFHSVSYAQRLGLSLNPD